MDFDYTPDQIHLRKSVREFAEAEILPHVMEWDEEQIFPLEVIKKLGRLGYLGSIFPEEYGGAGLGYIEYAIIIEELSRVDGSVGIIVAAHTSLCSNHIYKAGTEEQRQRYLNKLTTGEWIGCWSLTEPEAGSDAAGTRTSAAKHGECWVLNGAKTFTTNAHYADVCVAMAVTDRAGAQHGISAFIIEKGTPGFRTGKNSQARKKPERSYDEQDQESRRGQIRRTQQPDDSMRPGDQFRLQLDSIVSRAVRRCRRDTDCPRDPRSTAGGASTGTSAALSIARPQAGHSLLGLGMTLV